MYITSVTPYIPGWMEQKIHLLEHVHSFAISRFSPRIKLESICRASARPSASWSTAPHFSLQYGRSEEPKPLKAASSVGAR